MANTPIQTYQLIPLPFSSATDFTVLADYCEHYAESLLENSDPAQRQGLCCRLAACLDLLQPTLEDPIPPHLIDSLTVDDLPLTSPRFEPDSDLLCGYCLVLVRLLTERVVLPQMEKILTGLLFDLVSYLADELRAPRWIRNDDGVKFIEETEGSGGR
ncbi:hypothetical protein [Sodalis sp. dw_96]|uniref:hypothetical protein n=1 Tax=Sodalis sp. dw_96 TaxID=2719794 RepID=UPI001BD21D6E|nr:hypothetical protein [Sodalis sp. dw_96]